MNLPGRTDYIDIHTHTDTPVQHGVFAVVNYLIGDEKEPDFDSEGLYSAGIHPWHITTTDYKKGLELLRELSHRKNIVAIGEAGFDRIKGPSTDLQRMVFEEQAMLARNCGKPLIIHCVKGWEDLLRSHTALKPENKWLIHGFRGSRELAAQLITRGFYLSVWFDFALREASSDLIRSVPINRLFLETDGADVNIRDIYNKVSSDLGTTVEDLRKQIFSNFYDFFQLKGDIK